MSLIGRKLLHLKIVFLFSLSTFCVAQEVEIKSINPVLQNNKLLMQSQFKNLLNAQLLDGLESGMARILNFRFDLIQKNRKKILEVNRSIKLRFDVWENVYFFSKRKQQKRFDTFINFNRFLNDSLLFVLIPIDKLPLEKELQIVMYFSPENISENQKKKLDYWMNDENDSVSKAGDDDSQSGFSINLSGIISLFTRKELSKNTVISKSNFFTIKILKQNENTAQ